MSYTPGPWRVDSYDEFAMVVTPSGMEIGNATELESACLAIADARLIAAAPELLDALKRSLDWLASYPGDGALGVLDQARAAIAKAEG